MLWGTPIHFYENNIKNSIIIIYNIILALVLSNFVHKMICVCLYIYIYIYIYIQYIAKRM